MAVNIKKKNDAIDLAVMFIICIKFFINLMDFEGVRFTLDLTQKIYYYA
jgi:hypothetical protein